MTLARGGKREKEEIGKIGKIEKMRVVKLTSFAHDLTRKATIKRLPGRGAIESGLLVILPIKRHRIPQICRILLWVAIVPPKIPKRDLRIQGCWGASAYVGFWRSAKVGGSCAFVGQEIWQLRGNFWVGESGGVNGITYKRVSSRGGLILTCRHG